jgi:hypothetical protein
MVPIEKSMEYKILSYPRAKLRNFIIDKYYRNFHSSGPVDINVFLPINKIITIPEFSDLHGILTKDETKNI